MYLPNSDHRLLAMVTDTRLLVLATAEVSPVGQFILPGKPRASVWDTPSKDEDRLAVVGAGTVEVFCVLNKSVVHSATIPLEAVGVQWLPGPRLAVFQELPSLVSVWASDGVKWTASCHRSRFVRMADAHALLGLDQLCVLGRTSWAVPLPTTHATQLAACPSYSLLAVADLFGISVLYGPQVLATRPCPDLESLLWAAGCSGLGTILVATTTGVQAYTALLRPKYQLQLAARKMVWALGDQGYARNPQGVSSRGTPRMLLCPAGRYLAAHAARAVYIWDTLMEPAELVAALVHARPVHRLVWGGGCLQIYLESGPQMGLWDAEGGARAAEFALDRITGSCPAHRLAWNRSRLAIGPRGAGYGLS